MYESLREWMNIPIVVTPCTGRNARGDKIMGKAFTVDSYPVSEIKLVRNANGVDVVSSRHHYIDASASISLLDNILFEGEDLPIQAIETFYRAGKPDILVVYQ
jgi:hypothetical protein